MFCLLIAMWYENDKCYDDLINKIEKCYLPCSKNSTKIHVAMLPCKYAYVNCSCTVVVVS